jgi:hypothetical protein
MKNVPLGWLTPSEAQSVIEAVGISTAIDRFVTTGDDAAAAAQEIAYAVALKAVAPEILHKSDVGGVTSTSATMRRCAWRFGRSPHVRAGRRRGDGADAPYCLLIGSWPDPAVPYHGSPCSWRT